MFLERFRPLLMIAAGAVLLGWGGFVAVSGAQTAQAAKAAPSAQSNKIVLKNFMFEPASLTVKAGSTVTWTNMDEEPHTVVSSSGLFRSNGLDTKDTFSFKFDKPGTYGFICSIHPQMVGTIVVQ